MTTAMKTRKGQIADPPKKVMKIKDMIFMKEVPKMSKLGRHLPTEKNPNKDRAIRMIDRTYDGTPKSRTKTIEKIVALGVKPTTARAWYFTRSRQLRDQEGK